MYISIGTQMSFRCKKKEFDRCFNRLDRPVKESRPDRFPPLVVNNKPKILYDRKETFRAQKPLQFRQKNFFLFIFWSSRNFGHKNRSILG